MPTSSSEFSASEQPYPSAASRSTSPVLPGSQAVTRGYSHSCPTCDAPMRANQATCTQCGSQVSKRPASIRCRHCRQQASSQLVLCPGCGRELQAASSTLWTLALPGALVALLVVVLVGHVSISALGWDPQLNAGLPVMENISITPVRSQAASTEGNPEGNTLIALRPLAPATQNTPTPVPTEESEPASEEPSVVIMAEVDDETTATEDETAEQSQVVAMVMTTLSATAKPTQTAEATATLPVPTATNTPAPTATNTALPTATNTTPPTATTLPTRVTPVAPTATEATGFSAQSSRESRAASFLISPEPTATSTSNAVIIALASVVPTSTPTQSPTATPTPSPTATPTLTPTSIPWSSYTVKTGDTLVGIAARFGISANTLMEANGLTVINAADLQIGRVLVLPGVAAADSTATQTYIVRPGDTLVGIALRFAVEPGLLTQVNGLTAESARVLQVGQVLVIPASGDSSSTTLPVQSVSVPTRPPATPTPAPIQYTVKPGDTIAVIAYRFGTNTQAVLALNGISPDAPIIRPGDVLLIPPTP